MIPSLASFHPQIVHFVVGCLFIGVLFRAISLTGRVSFVGPAATTLLLLGTAAAVAAVQSGTDAHAPVERIPGVRDAVMEHEDDGHMTRNIFLGVAALELIGLTLKNPRQQRWVYLASTVVGVVGAGYLFETADHGGDIVYSYGGGPGLRTGDPADIQRLLVAGLYNEAMAA